MISSFGLAFVFCGKFSVSERGEKNEHGGYNSIELVNKNIEDISLDIDVNEEGLISLSISDYHIENEETKRWFHSNLECYLSRRDVLSIIEALSFAVKSTNAGKDTL